MRTTGVWVVIAVQILSPAVAGALEPVCAVDDPFAVPGAYDTPGAVFAWPGSECAMQGAFAAAAWNVPYGLYELAATTVAAGWRGGAFAVSGIVNASGFDLYGEDSEKFGIAATPLDGLSIGLRLTRQAMRIEGFGQAAAWSADAGIVLEPFPSVTVSIAREDLAGATLGRSREPLDGRSRMGLSWDAGRMRVVAGVSKVRRFDPSVEAGFLAELHESLTIGVAGGSEPDRYMFLCGLVIRGMQISYRGGWHPELGMSHGFSIAHGSVVTRAGLPG